MSIYETAVRKPITTALIYVAIAVLGLFALSRLSIELMPKTETTSVMVVTSYPGASAADKSERPAEQSAPALPSAADKGIASRHSPASGSTPTAVSASATDKASPHATSGPAAALRAGTPPKGESPVRHVPSTGHARDLFRGSLGKA